MAARNIPVNDQRALDAWVESVEARLENLGRGGNRGPRSSFGLPFLLAGANGPSDIFEFFQADDDSLCIRHIPTGNVECFGGGPAAAADCTNTRVAWNVRNLFFQGDAESTPIEVQQGAEFMQIDCLGYVHANGYIAGIGGTLTGSGFPIELQIPYSVIPAEPGQWEVGSFTCFFGFDEPDAPPTVYENNYARGIVMVVPSVDRDGTYALQFFTDRSAGALGSGADSFDIDAGFALWFNAHWPTEGTTSFSVGPA